MLPTYGAEEDVNSEKLQDLPRGLINISVLNRSIGSEGLSLTRLLALLVSCKVFM